MNVMTTCPNCKLLMFLHEIDDHRCPEESGDFDAVENHKAMQDNSMLIDVPSLDEDEDEDFFK